MTTNHSVKVRVSKAGSLIVAAILLLICVVPASGSDLKKVDLYALLVGVKNYQDPANNRLSIQGTTDLYDFLVERKNLFNKVHIAFLEDQQATKANIERVWEKELDRARKDDVVMIFLDGHGAFHPSGHYYFLPYDAGPDLLKTAIRVSDKKLFSAIRSERLLLMTGSCFSGGYLAGLAKGRDMGASVDFFQDLRGRFGISAAKNDEVAWVPQKFGMNVFTFYVTKGLRGEAASTDGKITIKALYEYIARNVERDTNGAQHPQLYYAKGDPNNTTIYTTPTYPKKLEIDLKFFYETDDNRVVPLTDETVLKSGQHVGIAFKPNADCYVHILWWDSTGQVGRLFPNPQLTQGTGEVKGGQTHWLPFKDGKHWYVLDNTPGYETVYFVASRERNPKLEELYEKMKALSTEAKKGAKGADLAEQIEREINLMGFANYTVPVKTGQSYENKEKLFEDLEANIKVAGAEAFFKLRFKHDPS